MEGLALLGMVIAQSHSRLLFIPAEVVAVDKRRRNKMLWTIFVILLVLWLLGVVSSYTIGGFIHLLLVLALVVLLINIISGRRPAI